MALPHQFTVFKSTDSSSKVTLRRVVVIVNPKSGGQRGLKILAQVKPLLEKGGATVKVIETQYAGHARDLAQKEDLSEVDVLAPIGGDGTCHETINGFMTRDDYAAVKNRVVVSIIPGGTGNTLAYDLRLNSPAKAVECLLRGDVRAIDIGKVEHLSTDNPDHPVDTSQHAVFSCNIIGCVCGVWLLTCRVSLSLRARVLHLPRLSFPLDGSLVHFLAAPARSLPVARVPPACRPRAAATD